MVKTFVLTKLIPIAFLPTSQIYGSTPLKYFSPVSHFYTPWKRQKTKGFLTYSGGIEMWRLNDAVCLLRPIILNEYMHIEL